VEPLYGFSFPDPVEVSTRAAADGSSVYVLEDKEMDFDEILKAPLPKAPLEVTFRAHWLAIEGVQPLIPENPLPDGMDVLGSGKKRKAADLTDGADKDPTVQEVLPQELQLYYENVTSAVLQGSPHLLSAALQSLRSDPGLQALLPYLTQFITDEVRRSLKDLPILNALLSMTAAILSNKQLHVEPHLHLLMPAVITCMVGKQLCKTNLEPHWALRDRAARLLTFICHRYSAPYSTLQQRITTTLMHAFLDASKPLTTNYGAVVGLSALGAQVPAPPPSLPSLPPVPPLPVLWLCNMLTLLCKQTMKQLVVPNTSAMCAVLHSTILTVKKPCNNGKAVVLGVVQVFVFK